MRNELVSNDVVKTILLLTICTCFTKLAELLCDDGPGKHMNGGTCCCHEALVPSHLRRLG